MTEYLGPAAATKPNTPTINSSAGSTRIHRPQVETIQNHARSNQKKYPKAATANAASFVDTSLVDQLIKEGYYK